jgi:hypothetical protein
MEKLASASCRPRWATLAKSALGAAVALGTLTVGPAKALLVQVNGITYNVTTFGPGSYTANASKFALPSNGGVMPWWGSKSLATQFAYSIGTSLGLPNAGGDGAPYLAYGTISNILVSSINLTGSGLISEPNNQFSDSTITWAQVVPVSAPVPGPLPALGAAAAFGFSRQLRKRIKITKSVSSAAPSV